MRLIFLVLLFASPLAAQEPPALRCTGASPDWTLSLSQTDGALSYLRDSQMEIRHRARAEGQDFPQALTLIGRDDTAIVVLRQRACGGAPYEVDILTQRGETPILLTGCCETTE